MILHGIGLFVLGIALVSIIVRKRRLRLIGLDAKINHLWFFSLFIILVSTIMFWINQAIIYNILVTPLIPTELISEMVKTNIIYSLSYLGIVFLSIIGIVYLKKIKTKHSIHNDIEQFGNADEQDLV